MKPRFLTEPADLWWEMLLLGYLGQRNLSTEGRERLQIRAGEPKYRYNNKELNEDFGLDWYDYGARWYDVSIGRWNAVDPLAEKYQPWSPYNYTLNNPIIHTDPNGMSVDGEYLRDTDGNWKKVSTVGDDIGVDFYHEDASAATGNIQMTRIVDNQGNENYITGGRELLGNGKGDSRPHYDGDWKELYKEWRSGTGPETSIFEGNHPNNEAIQESNWLQDRIMEFSSSGARSAGPLGFDWDTGIRATLQGNNTMEFPQKTRQVA